MPCSSSYSPRIVQEGQYSRSEGKGIFYYLISSKPKFYLDSFPILDLSLKVFQWMGISSHLLHCFPPVSVLNEIWAWKQVFRSYFQFPNLDSLFLTAMNSFLLAKEIPCRFHSSVPVWPEAPQLFSLLAFHSQKTDKSICNEREIFHILFFSYRLPVPTPFHAQNKP